MKLNERHLHCRTPIPLTRRPIAVAPLRPTPGARRSVKKAGQGQSLLVCSGNCEGVDLNLRRLVLAKERIFYS